MKDVICSVCGNKIKTKASSEHIYPKAIYKWLQPIISEKEYDILKFLITTPTNIVYSHPMCNLNKAEEIVNIDKLYISDKQKKKIKKLRQPLDPYINKYLKLKIKLFNKQNMKCYKCGADMNRIGVLRRINRRKPRTIENACIVCNDCNKATSFNRGWYIRKDNTK